MLLKMFTVYDSKSKLYMQPMFFQTTGMAARSFEDTVNTKDHVFNNHPEDFTLFEIGVYDDNSAAVQMLDTPISLGVAVELIKQE